MRHLGRKILLLCVLLSLFALASSQAADSQTAWVEWVVDVFSAFFKFLKDYGAGLSGIAIAIFAILNWWIYRSQHKISFDPELKGYFGYTFETFKDLPEFPGGHLKFWFVFVNIGAIPIIVNHLEEVHEWNGRETKPAERIEKPFFSLPDERPPRTYITQLPWMIKGGDFAIWSRRERITKVHPAITDGGGINIEVIVSYSTGPKNKELRIPAQII